MPYVSRAAGKVTALFAQAQDFATEWLEDDDPEVTAFHSLPPPVPSAISRRQFFQQATVAGIVTQGEALEAMRTGALPSALQAIVDALPEGDRFGAEMALAVQTFERSHPLTDVIAGALGIDADAFFTAAGAL